ncbi:MAG: hypothetical protein CK425_02490 [Parachlamydia sp.]|nr:MAG: hypothetical protein CK425_02490 [Parachlamydia sp.]
MVRINHLNLNERTLAEPTPAAKKNKFSRFFVKVFRALCFWKKKSDLNSFLDKNITILSTADHLIHQPKPVEPPKKSRIFSVKLASTKPTPDVKLKKSTKHFSPALDQMQLSIHELMEKVFNCIHDKYEVNERMQYLDKGMAVLPGYLKAFAKILVQTANKASLPLIQTLNNTDIPKEEIEASLKQVFNWLIDPSHKNVVFKEEIREAMSKRLAKLQIPPGQNLETNYIAPLLDWALLSDFSQHPKKLRTDFHEETFNAVFEELGILLLEKKIDTFDLMMKKTLGPKSLSKIVDKMLHDNFMHITDFLTERTADLIHNAAYAKAFDAGIKAIDEHIKAQINSKTPLDFAKDPACHPAIKRQITGMDKESEVAFLSLMIDELYQLLLPSVPGENPIANLWRQKVIPEEFRLLLSEGKILFDQLLTPTMMQHLHTAKAEGSTLIEHAIGQLIEKHVKQQIKAQIQQVLHKLENKAALDQLMADQVFSAINQQLVQACQQHELEEEQHLKLIAERFNQFFITTPSPAPDELYKKIAGDLIGWTQDVLNIPEISQETKQASALNLAEKIHKFLGDTQSTDEHLPMLDRIKKFNTAGPKEALKDIYGTIAVDVLFKMGKIDEKILKALLGQTFGNAAQGLGGGDAIVYFVKDTLCQVLSNSLAPYSNSPDKLLSTLTENLDKKFKKQEDVEKLFFSKQPPTPPVKDPQQELKKQIELTSNLVITLLNQSMSTQNALKKKALRVALPPKVLQDSIHTIYQECFGDPQKLKSLAFTITELTVKTLRESDKKIKK